MIRRLLRSRAGTAVVEFAIVLPTLLTLLIGLIEVGRFAYLAATCAHAARAGAQYGAQNVITADDTTGIQNAVLHDSGNPNFTVSVSHTCAESNTVVSCVGQPVSGEVYYVQVKVTGQFSSMFKYPGIPSSISLSQTSSTRLGSQ